MPELDLWDYGELKWNQLCPMSVVVIGAVHQIFCFSPLWEHGRMYFLFFFMLGWGHVRNPGQYVMTVHHSIVMYYFRAGVFICRHEPTQGSLPSATVTGNIVHCHLVPESPSLAFIDRQPGLEINCSYFNKGDICYLPAGYPVPSQLMQ